ncbi:abortive phage infection protein [Natrinema saccharevitans]|uniref:Abortive phage infection protein n=1 Tax=Natrinema saccharevitans TaxID=301967 RepID=A0A1S8AYZ2_9EURY|nr:CPBP family glutamic-type intramembrane protease [Natrinema saccharevitans]OLZ41827.1 abortive phage infection protein [Natrinema saccharevitans]
MPQWATFLGLTGVVLALLLVLSHLTQSAFTDGIDGSSDGVADPTAGDSTAGRDPPTDAGLRSSTDASPESPADDANPTSRTDTDSRSRDGRDRPGSTPERDASDGASADGQSPTTPPTATDDDPAPDSERDRTSSRAPGPALEGGQLGPADRGVDPDSLSTGMVLANVAFSQGLFALLLLGAAIYTAIPASALGVEFSLGYLESGLLLGTVAGLAFYVANELAAAGATRFGFDHDEALRELLSPDSLGGWIVLLVGVLPIIAGFEELLFRAALIGVPAAGYGVSPWLLAVGSSIAFALGHGMQGSVGVVVTGLLGFGLAAVYVLTGSLLVVVVAHYLVNALEFVVHEGLGLEWAETLEG